MASRRRLVLYAASFFVTSLLLGLGIHKYLNPSPIPIALPSSRPAPRPFQGHNGAPCPDRAPWLSRLKVPFPYEYTRRDVIVRPNDTLKRASLTKLDEPLHPAFETIDADNLDLKITNCFEPLRLDVSAWPIEYPDASSLLFGVVTSLERLSTSIPFWARWLSYTNAKLVVMIVGPDDHGPPRSSIRAAEAQLRHAGIAATVVPPLSKDHGMDKRYLSLLVVLHKQKTPATEWIIIIDDDTFFPSLTNLLSTLQRYDHTQFYYLGAMSEDWWTVGRYSFMAMGGAGIILSSPFLTHLQQFYARCQEESRASAGDLRIYECIKWYTDIRLTHVPGLYQFDENGDRSGFYEAGRNPLSLHHWKQGWWDEGNLGNDRAGRTNWFPMDAMHLVADVCATCFLQRWQFGNQTILSNGYTVSTYPTGVLQNFEAHRGWEKLEETWGASWVEGSLNPGWEHYLGVLRPMLELEREKVQWRFLDAWKEDGGAVRQFYHHFGVEGGRDGVVELFWIREEEFESGKGA